MKPKFKVGDKVKMRSPDLYGFTEGKIVSVEKAFQELYPNSDEFDMDGLRTLEQTINSIVIPYEFDGEYLTVHYPSDKSNPKGKILKSKFYGYSYTIETPELRSIYPEHALKKID